MNVCLSSRLSLLYYLSLMTLYAQADPAYLRKYTNNPSEWVRPEKIPYPKGNPQTSSKIELGKKLFFDPILSRAKTISCASCHNPTKGWSDGNKVAIGDNESNGRRNSPTILNSAYQYTYFWDGREKSLEAQALGPLMTQVEMNLDPEKAVNRLRGVREYVSMFKVAFPKEGITVKTLAQAIASFERTIVSGRSRFDHWISGDAAAISKQEAEGFSIFLDKGNCAICHQGFNFSDQSFNNIGLGGSDIGRYSVKKRDIWHGTFKTPTLRNIAHSAPYFHDGSVDKLADAVSICAQGGRDLDAKNKTQLLTNKNLTMQQIEKIVKFLGTLSEEVSDL